MQKDYQRLLSTEGTSSPSLTGESAKSHDSFSGRITDQTGFGGRRRRSRGRPASDFRRGHVGWNGRSIPAETTPWREHRRCRRAGDQPHFRRWKSSSTVSSALSRPDEHTTASVSTRRLLGGPRAHEHGEESGFHDPLHRRTDNGGFTSDRRKYSCYWRSDGSR